MHLRRNIFACVWLSTLNVLGLHAAHEHGHVAKALQVSSTLNPLKIYVHNVSSRFRDNKEAWTWIHTSLYGLELTFPEYLLQSPYITSNPEEADYFYVHAWIYNSQFRDMDALIMELKQAGPWWDRKGGKDHIFVLVHDLGLCDNAVGSQPAPAQFGKYLSQSIVLEHWGKPTGVTPNNPCMIFDRWPTECDQVFQMVAYEENGFHPVPCYTPGKDIVVPTVTSEAPKTTRYLNSDYKNLTQNTLVIFGGGINQTHLTDSSRPESDAGYSFGVRQTFARMYHNHPEIKIFYKMVDDYWIHFHGSVFCLAPAGWGWGARVKSAVTRGCIPVIVQDGIKVDWEDELPMHEFAIRLPFMYLHRLPEILHKFKRIGRAAQMQANLACVWQLFWWTRPHGRAFEMTMCVLKARRDGGQKVQIDFKSCTLKCGNSAAVDFRAAMNLV